jgi:hypothetical protein
MLQSKALKECKEPSKLYLWWIETKISKYYYDFTHKFIKKPIQQVIKLYQWYKNVFKNDYDFDGHALFAIIEYKLMRLQDNLLNGHAYQDPKDLKALKLAIKLAGRLKLDDYDNRAHDRLEKKWGELNISFVPVSGESGYSTMVSSRPKIITEEDKIQERLDCNLQYELAYAKSKREERLLYAILHKYLRNLWD